MEVPYFPFGDCRNSTGDPGTDKLFTGQRLDDTGLYYYGARYYDAGIGRFISADTVIPNPSNPQAFNRYTYCLNNPLIYVDPSGNVVTIYGGDFTYYNPDDYYSWCWVTDEQLTMLNAWNTFKSVEGDIAAEMENDTNNIFNLQWTTDSSGATSLIYSKGSTNYYSVSIPNNFIKDNKGAAVIIAHESVHCVMNIYYPNRNNSLYEEAIAFRFMGKVASKLNYYSWPTQGYSIIGWNVFLANRIPISLGYNNLWLMICLNVFELQYNVNAALQGTSIQALPDDELQFDFLQHHFDLGVR